MRHGKGKALKRIGGVILALACTVALSLGATPRRLLGQRRLGRSV